MRISNREEDRKKKQKKQSSIIEAEVMAIIQASLKKCVDSAMDDIFKDFGFSTK